MITENAKVFSPTNSNFSENRVMMFSRGSEWPKKPQTAGEADKIQKKHQPLSKKIVMQKARGDRVEFFKGT